MEFFSWGTVIVLILFTIYYLVQAKQEDERNAYIAHMERHHLNAPGTPTDIEKIIKCELKCKQLEENPLNRQIKKSIASGAMRGCVTGLISGGGLVDICVGGLTSGVISPLIVWISKLT
jgi:hypothetical protein